jgi:lipopolysaccharide transport system ATP-binding protein
MWSEENMSVVVKVEHLSKEYRLGTIGNGSLYKDIESWFAKKTGRPDPWVRMDEQSKIGRRDRFWALKDVNFEVEQGERLAIIGRNGAGKSTLLKILSQITAPSEGQIKMRGRVASLLEVGTGFHPELTGRENIYLNGAILGMKKAEIDKNFDEMVAFSGIEPEFVDTPVKRYSSGMFVRLAFAVAAFLNSEILVADEVLAVGDQKFQEKCLGKMRDVSETQGRTVLFVSHNLSAVKQLCQTGILIERGRIVDTGKVDEVAKTYETMLSS